MNDSGPNLSARIEAILFYKGEPVSVRSLGSILSVSEESILGSLSELEENLRASARGIVLLRNGNEVTLGTAPQMGSLIESMLKDEVSKDLGKAGLETLAIVLYRGPISRSEVNYIRGVNSNYILRNLQVRGLIEKVDDTTARSITYRPTFELLSYMGVTKVEDLPEYTQVNEAIEIFKEGDTEDKENSNE